MSVRYGEEIVHTLSAQLTDEFGSGFSARNLFNVIKFAELFPDFGIVQTLSAQLGWSHFGFDKGRSRVVSYLATALPQKELS